MSEQQKADLLKRFYYVVGRIEALRAEWKTVIAERRALNEEMKGLRPPYDRKLFRQRAYLMERPAHITAELDALSSERKKLMASVKGDSGED